MKIKKNIYIYIYIYIYITLTHKTPRLNFHHFFFQSFNHSDYIKSYVIPPLA